MTVTDVRQRQLVYALGMLGVQAVVFGYLTRSVWYPSLVCLAALAGGTTSWRLQLPPERRFIAGALLTLPFLASWVAAPYDPPETRVFLLFPLVFAVGQYFLTLQAAQFLIRQPGQSITPLQPFFGTIVLLCAADVYVSRTQMVVYMVCVIAFVLFTAGFYGAARTFAISPGNRGSGVRTGLELTGLVLAAAATWFGCSILQRHWDDLERWFDPHRQSHAYSHLGFSREAHLGSIWDRKSKDADTTALRVFATAMPGYLRGAVYDAYGDRQWHASAQTHSLNPAMLQPPLVPAALTNRPVFALRPTPSSEWTSLEVWKDAQLPQDAIFAPLGASVFDAPVDTLLVDEHDVTLSTELSSGQEVVVNVPAERDSRVPSDDLLRRLTWVSRTHQGDPRLARLADEVFYGCSTPDQKVEAVADWFHENYQYSLDVDVPPGEEPLTWFLLQRPAAHCEFFASGACTLLRLHGIPARYVTGFVAAEYNPAGGYWIARNRDAHAWVEVYLESKGWVTVEATPEAGIPIPTTNLAASHFLDDLWLRILRLRSAITRSGWQGLFVATWDLVLVLCTTVPGWIVLGGIAGLASWRSLRSMRLFRLSCPRTPATELSEMLQRMDRRLQRFALIRDPAETLHQFATRIEQDARDRPELTAAAQWYLEFATLRYQGEAAGEAVQALKRRQPAV